MRDMSKYEKIIYVAEKTYIKDKYERMKSKTIDHFNIVPYFNNLMNNYMTSREKYKKSLSNSKSIKYNEPLSLINTLSNFYSSKFNKLISDINSNDNIQYGDIISGIRRDANKLMLSMDIGSANANKTTVSEACKQFLKSLTEYGYIDKIYIVIDQCIEKINKNMEQCSNNKLILYKKLKVDIYTVTRDVSKFIKNYHINSRKMFMSVGIE